MGLLDGRIAVITGAAKGLGRAVAQAYSDEGATVVIADIDAEAAPATATQIEGARGAACDMREETEVAALVDDVVREHGRLDTMVPNAGVGTVKPLAMMDLGEWRQVTSVNLDGVFLCVRYAAAAMAAGGGGTIVNMCSITALTGSPLIGHYAAAKAGVRSLTQTAAVELRDQNVRVNCICPGFVDTDLVGGQKAEFEAALGVEDFDAVIAAKQGRYGTAEEVARLAVFLASDRSRFSTGGSFTLDGGARASLL